MKPSYFLIVASIFFVASASGCAWSEKKGDDLTTRISMDTSPQIATNSGDLMASEIQGILLMREEEKLAFDVYRALGEKWGKQIFSNIMASEKTHMAGMESLITLYHLDDPVKGNLSGVYKNQELVKLYTELLEKGKRSQLDALQVGAMIEDLDISDLQKLSRKTKQQPIMGVYANLEKGSMNHLRAFTSQLRSFGVEYRPTHISQEVFSSIVH